MSPLQSILESFKQFAPGATIYVVVAELPNGQTVASALTDGVPTSVARPTASSVSADWAVKEANTPVTRVAALRAEYGPDTSLKISVWAKEVGISAKELRRAVAAGALAFEEKPDGRDNGAHMVTVGVMESYLKTVSAVEAGLEEPPIWWTDVRGRRAA